MRGLPADHAAFQGLVTEEQLLQLIAYVKSLAVEPSAARTPAATQTPAPAPAPKK